jgi:hypothetical protein
MKLVVTALRTYIGPHPTATVIPDDAWMAAHQDVTP